MKFLKSLFTDDAGDGEIVTVLGSIAVAVFLSLTVYVTLKTNTFSPLDFGTGIGLMLAGIGGGYFAKGRATPSV